MAKLVVLESDFCCIDDFFRATTIVEDITNQSCIRFSRDLKELAGRLIQDQDMVTTRNATNIYISPGLLIDV